MLLQPLSRFLVGKQDSKKARTVREKERLSSPRDWTFSIISTAFSCFQLTSCEESRRCREKKLLLFHGLSLQSEVCQGSMLLQNADVGRDCFVGTAQDRKWFFVVKGRLAFLAKDFKDLFLFVFLFQSTLVTPFFLFCHANTVFLSCASFQRLLMHLSFRSTNR